MQEPFYQGYCPIDDGAQIYFRIFGAGNPATVVLLHGNGEDYSAFKYQIGTLAARFRVVAIDSRGHGLSTDGDGISISKMADDAAAVLELLEIPRASIIGFSDGANTALYFALRHPGCLEKLVLVGANFQPDGLKPGFLAPAALCWAACRAAGVFSTDAKKQGALLGLMVREPHIAREDLRRITAPVLVVSGEHDLIRPAHTALLAASLPDSQLYTVPGAGHAVLLERPALLNQILFKFLGQP